MPLTNPFRGLPLYASLKDSLILVDDMMLNNSVDVRNSTTSETVSFLFGLEVWNGILNEEWEGYRYVNTPPLDKYLTYNYVESCYNRMYLIPYQVNQTDDIPVIENKTSYTPAGDSISDYPVISESSTLSPGYEMQVGFDPLFEGLANAYQTVLTEEDSLFPDTSRYDVMLLHHYALTSPHEIAMEEQLEDLEEIGSLSLDVPYFFYTNLWGRGKQESVFQTIPHPAYQVQQFQAQIYNKDFGSNGNVEDFPRDKFINNPNAEASILHWHHLAIINSRSQDKEDEIESTKKNINILSSYLQYNYLDGYFHRTDDNQLPYEEQGTGSPYLGLLNTHFEWQVRNLQNYTESGAFIRRGSSDCHHAYQNLMAARTVSTGEVNPMFDQQYFQNSQHRTLMLLRWLQSPEGPIAGGVTNSYNGRYEIPVDGRQNNRFFGLLYTYAPGKTNPPSNDWVGWQTTGHMSTADFFLEAAKANEANNVIMVEIILDRLVKWFMDQAELTANNHFVLPTQLRWTSSTEIVGQTTSIPNNEGRYEYLPSFNISANSDPSSYNSNNLTFWNTTSVPNPNLHCFVTEENEDVGIASSLAYLLIVYAQAKRVLNKYTTPILGSPHTPASACLLARELLSRIWIHYRDDIGVFSTEVRSDYERMFESNTQVPSGVQLSPYLGFYSYDLTENSGFLSTRPHLEIDSQFSHIQDYYNGGSPPVFRYHRFWHNAVFAIANGAVHHHFKDIIYTE